MKNRLIPFVFVLSIAIYFSNGCNKGPLKPKDLPDLYPSVLILKQEGKPLENASIALIDPQEDGPNARWGISGASDQKGEAILKVNGLFKGCPVGKFKVVVIKHETEKLSAPPPAPNAVNDPIGYEKWRLQYENEKNQKIPKSFLLVEQKYTNIKTTPIEVEIKQGKNIIEVDVGKRVREIEKLQIQ